MNISALCIQRPIPAILLFLILSVTGLFAFHSLQIEEFPDIELPAVDVAISLPGATPSQMESEVTRKVEAALGNLSQVEHIASTIVEGVSITTVLFRTEKNMLSALDETRNAIAAVRSSLPSDTRDPDITRITTSASSILTYAVTAEGMDEQDLSWFVDSVVSKSLLAVSGVGSISRHGGVNREISIELDSARLKSLSLTTSDVSSQLFFLQQDVAGGAGNVNGAEQPVRTMGAVSSSSELADISIPLLHGRTVRLGDIATVKDTFAERRHMAMLNGKSIISFQVFKAKGSSELTVAEGVRAALATMNSQHAHVKITEISNNLHATEEQYSSAMQAIYEGCLLTLIVVWLFFRNIRATFISALALPLSILPTFLVLNLLGYTLNTVTLLALTLVVGVLVDDAIVEIENIERHLRMGKSPFRAAMDAADEIGLAVIATSITLIAIFLPTIFIGGTTGVIFAQFGWTASTAVFGSLLVARLLTPMLAAYFMKDTANIPASTAPHPRWLRNVMPRYLNLVRWCVERPVKTSAMAGVFFLSSIVLVTNLSVDFIPAGDAGLITVTVKTVPGSSIKEASVAAEAARLAALKEPEVTNIFTAIGTSEARGSGQAAMSDVENATMQISLKDQRKRSQQEIQKALSARFALIPGARFTIGTGDSGEKYSVTLAGDDSALLQSTALHIADDMRSLKGFGTVTTSASLLKPEIVIRPDPVNAAAFGLTTLAMSQALRIATTGDFDTNLAKLNLPTRQVPIRVRLDTHNNDGLVALSDVSLPSRNGPVPLSSVASLEVESGPARIDRLDRVRIVTVDMELNGRPLSDAAKAIQTISALQKLPQGITELASGDVEAQQQLFGDFGAIMLIGIFCVYGVLVLLFNDFVQPITILAPLPLAIGGGAFALWLFGFALSMSSLIGLLILMGIVTKNSILLIDYIIVARRKSGTSRSEAILDACEKRAKPIVMTTLAMIGGMFPMALGLQGDSSFRAPMGVVVIGGLVTSTVLSLVVVPVVYVILDNFSMRVALRLNLREAHL